MANLAIYECFLVLLMTRLGSSIVPVPIVDDLLGPGQCPSGSFCIETVYCTNEYFTTKTGLPFYCGPHHQIDSMICCVSVEADDGMHHESVDRLQPTDYNEVYPPQIRSNRSADNEDEVDIQTVPFSTNEGDEELFDASDSNLDVGGHFRSFDDLESLIEDAIESDMNSASAQNARQTDSNEVNQDDSLHSQFPQEPIKIVINRGQGPQATHQDANDENAQVPELRAKIPHCTCEKGEKGDPGPRGEPGEPGKIVYIPVFVNAATGIPATATPSSQTGFAPVMTDPLQFASTYSPNQQHPSFGQNLPGVPQHSNPIVVPYNVPVNLPPVPTNPQQVPAPGPTSMAPQQQPTHFNAPSQPQPILQPQGQPSSAIPYPDSLQARLTRHANENKYTHNRRY